MSFTFRTIRFVFFLSLLATGGLFAQSTTQLSLDEAINYALNQNPTIKEAQLEISDADAQVIERRSIGLPQVTGEVSYQRYIEAPPLPPSFNTTGNIFNSFFLPENLNRFEELGINTIPLINTLDEIAATDATNSIFFRNNFTLGLNFDAMLFDGSYFVGLRAARAYRKYVQQDMTTKQREVKGQIVDAYLPVILVNKNLEILEKNITNLEKLLFETKELYKEGFAEQLDIDRLDLSLTNLKVEQDNLIRQGQNALQALKFAMGYPVNDEIEVTEDLEKMATEVAEEDLVGSFNPEVRPEVGLVDLGLELNQLNLSLYRSGYLPTLRAFGSYQQNYQGNTAEDGFWAPTALVGVRLNVPIFDGMDKRAKIQRARLDIEGVQIQRNTLTESIELEVSIARTNYISAKERLESQDANLKLAERIYDTTQIKYREGVGSSLEVTQAEQSVYTAQSNYLQALYEVVLAKQRLELALNR